MKYSEKLRDPRWQKLRLEVFKRDGWACQKCGDIENTLNIHHRRYIPERDPWDYPMVCLVTMCQDCHESERDEMLEYEGEIVEQLKDKFFGDDLRELACGINHLILRHISGVVASAYSMAFSDPEIQKELIDKYFKKLEKERKERG